LLINISFGDWRLHNLLFAVMLALDCLAPIYNIGHGYGIELESSEYYNSHFAVPHYTLRYAVFDARLSIAAAAV
jgi:hypothetical protein